MPRVSMSDPVGSPSGAAPRSPFDQRWYVHVDNKTYGPYTGNEIRPMATKGQIVETDLVHREDGSGWVQAKDDPALRLLFQNRLRSSPTRQLNISTRSRVVIAGAALVFITIAWIAWPYYAFYKLAVAFRTGDEQALEGSVAWDSVRQGLRSDLNALLLQKLKTGPNDKNAEPGAALGTGFAAVLGPTVINQLVESYITPQSVAAMSRESRADTAKTNQSGSPNNLIQALQSVGGVNSKQVEYMFFSGEPFTFKVQIRPERDPPLKSPFTLLFNWSGNWKLTRILFPPDAFENATPPIRQNAAGLERNNVPLLPAYTQATNSVAANGETAQNTKKQEYIKNLEIYDFKARYYDTFLDGKVPGIEFKIKNNGTETLDMVKVTVYFKNAQGKTIAEEGYAPVFVSPYSLSDNKPLRPNYIWQLERGKFYTAKSVPSEWKEGAAEIRITDLRFEGDAKHN